MPQELIQSKQEYPLVNTADVNTKSMSGWVSHNEHCHSHMELKINVGDRQWSDIRDKPWTQPTLYSFFSFSFFVEGREPSKRAVKVRTRGIHYVGAETFDICAAFSPIKRHCMALIAECGTLRLYRVTVCNLGIVFPIMFVPCFICCFLLFFPKLVYNFQPKFVSETQPVRGWRHSHAFCKTTVTQDNG